MPPSASDNEAWRSEVASRVQHYRERQKDRTAGRGRKPRVPAHPSQLQACRGSFGSSREQSPAATPVANETTADFVGEPVMDAPNWYGMHSEAVAGVLGRKPVPGAPGSEPGQNAEGALDTNYYRRLNASHALEQSARASQEAPGWVAGAAAAQLLNDFADDLAYPAVEDSASQLLPGRAFSNVSLLLRRAPLTLPAGDPMQRARCLSIWNYTRPLRERHAWTATASMTGRSPDLR